MGVNLQTATYEELITLPYFNEPIVSVIFELRRINSLTLIDLCARTSLQMEVFVNLIEAGVIEDLPYSRSNPVYRNVSYSSYGPVSYHPFIHPYSNVSFPPFHPYTQPHFPNRSFHTIQNGTPLVNRIGREVRSYPQPETLEGLREELQLLRAERDHLRSSIEADRRHSNGRHSKHCRSSGRFPKVHLR